MQPRKILNLKNTKIASLFNYSSHITFLSIRSFHQNSSMIWPASLHIFLPDGQFFKAKLCYNSLCHSLPYSLFHSYNFKHGALDIRIVKVTQTLFPFLYFFSLIIFSFFLYLLLYLSLYHCNTYSLNSVLLFLSHLCVQRAMKKTFTFVIDIRQRESKNKGKI